MAPDISIVIPVYGCKESIYELCFRLKNELIKITVNYEILLIDDCGPDDPWKLIGELAATDKHIKGIKLSRNFGQHKAIHAGLEYSKGEWVVVMDCDLQDRPEEIIKLYNEAKNGFEIVLGRRVERKDSFVKRIYSKVFYKVLGYLTETKQDSSIANFGIYNRKVISAICSMKDTSRYFPAMVRWVGFRQGQIDIQHAQRTTGTTSYSFRKLLHLGLEVILAFSDKPLRIMVKTGILISILSFLFAIYVIIEYFSGKIQVLGYASLFVSIWLFSGIIIFLIGMVGLYIGKTYESVKGRPVYIVNETVNVESD
jgi:glycosyltransferase involved in cell wall biosynthesis